MGTIRMYKAEGKTMSQVPQVLIGLRSVLIQCVGY
jgi:hypothetical protein